MLEMERTADLKERTLLHHEVIADNPDAPWLVFVHGAGGSIRTWKFQVEAFSPHYRLLLIDLRDHGYSKDIMPEFPAYDFDIVAKDILGVIDYLNIQKAHFMSLSIGSVILQKIDIERPDLVDRMVMAGAIFDGSKAHALVCAFGQNAVSYMLAVPRAVLDCSASSCLPRRNHRLSRYIFRRQSRRLTTREYHEVDRAVQADFSHSIQATT